MYRFFKPLLIALLTFIAVKYLGGTSLQSFGIAAIPLIFGWLRFATFLGDVVAAVAITAAIFWAVSTPETRASVTQRIDQFMSVEKSGDT